jgi:hypothetical protein
MELQPPQKVKDELERFKRLGFDKASIIYNANNSNFFVALTPISWAKNQLFLTQI